MVNNVPYNAHCREYGEKIAQCSSLQDVTRMFLDEGGKLHPRGRILPPYRMLCVTPQFFQEWENVLPFIKPIWAPDDDPKSQVVDILEAYCAGDSLAVPEETHDVDPTMCFCWEFKTPDVRIYGWYVVKDFFIAARLADANETHKPGAYSRVSEMVREMRCFREALCLPFCNPITGKAQRHVLSNRIG